MRPVVLLVHCDLWGGILNNEGTRDSRLEERPTVREPFDK